MRKQAGQIEMHTERCSPGSLSGSFPSFVRCEPVEGSGLGGEAASPLCIHLSCKECHKLPLSKEKQSAITRLWNPECWCVSTVQQLWASCPRITGSDGKNANGYGEGCSHDPIQLTHATTHLTWRLHGKKYSKFSSTSCTHQRLRCLLRIPNYIVTKLEPKHGSVQEMPLKDGDDWKRRRTQSPMFLNLARFGWLPSERHGPFTIAPVVR